MSAIVTADAPTLTLPTPPASALPLAETTDVLSLADAALFLRVPEVAVRHEAAMGQLPGRLIGGEWRFSRAGILAWLGTPAPPRPTIAQWLKDNPPRVWDEAAQREADQELAEMAAIRKSWGLANPEAAAADAAEAAEAAASEARP